MFETGVRDGVLRFRATGDRWLSTGVGGGVARADAAYNLTVPDGFDRTDLEAYAAGRRRRAGYDEPGPTLLTGVDVAHARGARAGDAVVVATAGLSNPAPLPVEPDDGGGSASGGDAPGGPPPRHDGTVNLLVGTGRALDDGGLAELVAVAAEAKAATLLALAGVPGTTTDAVVAGCDPAGEPARFAGSGTALGADLRACVRDALGAALEARHPDGDLPVVVAGAEHPVSTDRRAEVFEV